MKDMLHATFATEEEGLHAARALLYRGLHAQDISLILPLPPNASTSRTVDSLEAPGYTYDALGAVIRDPIPSTEPPLPRNKFKEANQDAAEGAGLGLGLGLLAAMCIPGIGMIAGSGMIVAGLVAGSAAAGGIAGGIYGYLIDLGVAHGIAQIMKNHLEGGGTTLSVSVSKPDDKTDIVRILKKFGGHLIQPS